MFYYVSVGEQKHGDKGSSLIGFPPIQVFTSLTGKSKRSSAARILRKFLVDTTKGLALVHHLDPGSMDSEFLLE